MLRFALPITIISSALAAAPALMPLPVMVQPATGKLTLDATFKVALGGVPDARLDAAVGRFVVRLSRRTGIPMLGLKDAAPKLRVVCAGAGSEYPALGEDESYTLDVTEEGALLKAPTRSGALHGLETFGQLVTLGKDGFEVPAVHIEDSPRFPWRGLMMDAARHWMPLEVVKRNLDAMAAAAPARMPRSTSPATRRRGWWLIRNWGPTRDRMRWGASGVCTRARSTPAARRPTPSSTPFSRRWRDSSQTRIFTSAAMKWRTSSGTRRRACRRGRNRIT